MYSSSDEKENMAVQPKKLTRSLYKHQLASLYKMEKLETQQKIEHIDTIVETTMGINANQTGYGKTIEMVSLVLNDKMAWNMEESFIIKNVITKAGGKIKKLIITQKERMNTTLILSSPSIVHQWLKEFSYTDLRVIKITRRKEINNLKIDNYDVVIVVPSMYNKLIMNYADSAWKRFIFDEPGHIKVPGMKNIHAGFYWFVTATPNAMVGKHKKCSSFMSDIVNTHYHYWEDIEWTYKDVMVRNSIEFMKESFTMPPVNNYYHQCYDPLYQTIKGIASTNIANLVASGDIHKAIELLGGKETKNITELVKRKKLEELEEIGARIRIYKLRDDEQKIEEWENKYNRVQKQINELDSRFENILSAQCNICFDTLEKPIMEPKCQNVFCGSCLLTWLSKKDSCPMCRSKIDENELVYIKYKNEEEKKTSNKPKQVSRPNKIVDIINKSSDDKYFLIFSSSGESFIPIRNILKENNISFCEIDGANTRRENNIKKYRSGEIKVIFINSSINASGITLTETTDIIIYHEMSDSVLTQIIGRANRLGRKVSLDVHHLVI